MALPFNLTPQAVISNANAALSFLGLTSRIDVVGIYDGDTLTQLFTDARPMRGDIRKLARVMSRPVETGVTLSDHRISLPIQIELPLVIPSAAYSSTYQQLTQAWNNATKLTVQTKAGVFPNMIIEALPHREDPEMFDSIMLNLRLIEVQFVAPSSIAQPNAPANYSPSNPQNQSIVARGLQSPLIVTLPAAILGYVNSIAAWGR